MLRTTLSRQGRLRLSARSTFSSVRTSPSIAIIPLSPLSSSALPVRTSSSLSLTTLRSYSTTPPASASTPSPSPIPSSPFRRLFRRRPSSSSSSSSPRASRKPLPKYSLPLGILLFILISTASYELIPPTRHFALAIIRCSVLMQAVIADAIDYKLTWRKSTEGMSLEEVRKVHSDCHKRSAERLLKSLEALGGIYIKLGQHLSSVAVLPVEWSGTMSVLQDRCPASSLSQIDDMILQDTGKSRELYFSDWNPNPIGIASIAQVHLATDRETGQRVAVKLQHPGLEEFSKVDMATVNFAVKLIDWAFPDFEFSWLAKEMNEQLPLEMDFRIEAKNAARTTQDFAQFPSCTLYVPEVRWVEKRILVMEFIEGARVDNHEYLDKHKIDRNLVSKELSRIFSQQVYLNGFFHADPHQGNVLIRPKPMTGSRSPYNFEVVLLDHGQYFDLDDDLRVNYARLWLSLIEPNSPEVQMKRRKYAKLVGNIGEDLYLILESALTGRVGLASPPSPTALAPEEYTSDHHRDPSVPLMTQRANSVMSMDAVSEAEMEHMRLAVVEREGLLQDIFRMLRSVPRRILIVIKLNDLTRSLDKSLETTHDQSRPFLIVARYCCRSIYLSELSLLSRRWLSEGFSLSLLRDWLRSWWQYRTKNDALRLVEIWQDGKGMWVKWKQDGGLWKKEAGGKVREAAAAAAAVGTGGAQDAGRLALAV